MPGFPPACPVYAFCLYDSWQTLVATLMYVVIAEAVLLAVWAIFARRGQRMLVSGLAAPLLVALCAFVTIAGVWWISQHTTSLYVPPVHYTPQTGIAIDRAVTDMWRRLVVPLGVIAFAFVLGTAITAATLIRSAVTSRIGRPAD